MSCIVLADYLGAHTPLDTVSMYVEHALKLHSSQIAIRPINWRVSSRLRGAVIILPDAAAAQQLVQYVQQHVTKRHQLICVNNCCLVADNSE